MAHRKNIKNERFCLSFLPKDSRGRLSLQTRRSYGYIVGEGLAPPEKSVHIPPRDPSLRSRMTAEWAFRKDFEKLIFV